MCWLLISITILVVLINITESFLSPLCLLKSPNKSTQSKVSAKSALFWSASSWREFPMQQAPTYTNQEDLSSVLELLKHSLPLVQPPEIRALQDQLAQIALGKGLLLMGGDCAETFQEFSSAHIKGTYDILQQMRSILSYGSGLPVTPIGRMAGQFAKPRSENMETRDGQSLPSYRGDIINDEKFTENSRIPNPQRMLRAYSQSVQTMNLLRSLQHCENQDLLKHIMERNNRYMGIHLNSKHYGPLIKSIEDAHHFAKANDMTFLSNAHSSFYTGHECLLLPYEESFLVKEEHSQCTFATSAHFLWIGERTRQLDHAHLHFVSGLANPIGIKISDKISPDELIRLLNLVNSRNIPGRVTLIVRMGADKVRKYLPILVEAVKSSGHTVVWCSDPVHSNTIRTSNGYKTRPFHMICDEINAFFDVHAKMGTHAGGIHLELTGKHVTECVGGSLGSSVTEETMGDHYLTSCDPRLNDNQALEVALLVADRMKKEQKL